MEECEDSGLIILAAVIPALFILPILIIILYFLVVHIQNRKKDRRERQRLRNPVENAMVP